MHWGMGWMWLTWIGAAVAVVAAIGWALTSSARRGERESCPEADLQRQYDHGEISGRQLQRRRRIIERGPRGDAGGVETAVDPICGMTVREDRAAATVTYGGQTYHFCSRQCRDRFEKAPEAVA